jgi:hypothetical protein
MMSKVFVARFYSLFDRKERNFQYYMLMLLADKFYLCCSRFENNCRMNVSFKGEPNIFSLSIGLFLFWGSINLVLYGYRCVCLVCCVVAHTSLRQGQYSLSVRLISVSETWQSVDPSWNAGGGVRSFEGCNGENRYSPYRTITKTQKFIAFSSE